MMAREIEFRAKAITKDKHLGIKVGDFVYGSYIKTDIDAPCIVWGDGLQMEIDESTLGQFTGLIDANKVKIWEGDWLKNQHGRIAKIVWLEAKACFDLVFVKDTKDTRRIAYPAAGFDMYQLKFSTEVIGNDY